MWSLDRVVFAASYSAASLSPQATPLPPHSVPHKQKEKIGRGYPEHVANLYVMPAVGATLAIGTHSSWHVAEWRCTESAVVKDKRGCNKA